MINFVFKGKAVISTIPRTKGYLVVQLIQNFLRDPMYIRFYFLSVKVSLLLVINLLGFQFTNQNSSAKKSPFIYQCSYSKNILFEWLLWRRYRWWTNYIRGKFLQLVGVGCVKPMGSQLITLYCLVTVELWSLVYTSDARNLIQLLA